MSGNVEKVLELIKKSDVNGLDNNKEAALHLAANKG